MLLASHIQDLIVTVVPSRRADYVKVSAGHWPAMLILLAEGRF